MSGISSISSTYTPILLSHQTGLSITISSANTYYNIGSSISIPRNGIVNISVMAHVSGYSGSLNINLTRNSTQYISNSNLFYSFSNTSSQLINTNDLGSFTINVLKGDILQLMVTNSTASEIVYVDDLVVILQ